jgi:hypothetical protein
MIIRTFVVAFVQSFVSVESDEHEGKFQNALNSTDNEEQPL